MGQKILVNSSIWIQYSIRFKYGSSLTMHNIDCKNCQEGVEIVLGWNCDGLKLQWVQIVRVESVGVEIE